MLFVVFCLDKPDAAQARAASMEAHKRYLDEKPIKVVLSGPLTSDDGRQIVGSFFMVDAESRAEVQRWQDADPLYRAGVWESVEVRAFAKRIDNRD